VIRPVVADFMISFNQIVFNLHIFLQNMEFKWLVGVWAAEAAIKFFGITFYVPKVNNHNAVRGTQEGIIRHFDRSQNAFLPPLFVLERCGNDPSAGSPTETLLRLHLPLNDEV
jgi:hypothetical protein